MSPWLVAVGVATLLAVAVLGYLVWRLESAPDSPDDQGRETWRSSR